MDEDTDFCVFCSTRLVDGHQDDFRIQVNTHGERTLDMRFCCADHYEAFVCCNYHDHDGTCEFYKANQVLNDANSESTNDSNSGENTSEDTESTDDALSLFFHSEEPTCNAEHRAK